MAGITTLIGFGSLISSTVIPMKTFGTFTALGVTVSLIVALTFIPAVLLLRHKALKTAILKIKENVTERFMNFLYGVFHRNRGKIVFATLLIIAAGIFGTTRIVKDNILIDYFKKNTEISRSDRFLREKFNGTTTFDIIVKGEKKGSLTNPEVLDAMDNLSNYLEGKYPQVTNILSFTDFVKKMNQVMNSTAADTEPVYEETSGDTTGFSSFFAEDNSEPPASETISKSEKNKPHGPWDQTSLPITTF